MIDTVLGFLIGVALTPWFFGALLVFCWIFEHNECRFWSTVFLGLGVFTACKIFYVPQPFLNYGLIAYLPIGFGWSFWRWLRHCRSVAADAVKSKETVDKYNKEHQSHPYPSSFSADDFKHRLMLKYNIDKITYWILIWPVSFVDMFLGDLYDMVKHFVKNICGRGYKAIAQKYMSQIDALADPVKEEEYIKYD